MGSQLFDFVQADSTTLPAGLTESTNDSQTISNKLQPVTTGSICYVTTTNTLRGINQNVEAECDFVSIPTGGTPLSVGVYARSDSTGSNAYQAYITKDNAGAYAAVLAKRVGGGITVLQTTAISPSLPATVRLETNGPSLVMKVNGTTIHSITDTSIGSGRHFGSREFSQLSGRTVTLTNLYGEDALGNLATVVQSKTQATSNPAGITFDSAVTPGNLLIVAYGCSTTGTVTSEPWGQTADVAALVGAGSTGVRSRIFGRVAQPGESATVPTTFTSVGAVNITAYEFAPDAGYAWKATPFDKSQTATSTSSLTSLNSGNTATQTESNNVAISMWGVGADVSSPNATNGYTLIDMPPRRGTAYKFLASTAATSTVWQWTTAVNRIAITLATYQQEAAPTGGPGGSFIPFFL